MPLRDERQAVGCLRRRCKSESRRPPRTLADTERSFAVKCGEHGGDIGTCESRPALRGGEIIAETRLKLLDSGTEALNILLSDGGQRLHDDQPAELRGIAIGEGWQLAECRNLVGAMDPVACRIEHHNDPPAVREADMAHYRRRNLLARATAVDDESTTVKQSDADARACAAAEVDRISFNIERQVVQSANAGRHRQCELCAGAQACVGRNDVQYIHRMTIAEREALHHLIDVPRDASAFRPRYLIFRCPAERDFCT